MKVTIAPIPGSWERAVNAARMTQHMPPLGHEPSDKWKKQALQSEHSPIRVVEYDIVIEDAEYASVMHLVRHFMGVVPFCATSRPDITGEHVTRHEQRKDDPTTVQFSVNAQALINMSDRRCCFKAEKTTREIWEAVKEEMRRVDPVMAEAMQPRCVLRNGWCGERKPCGFCFSGKAFSDARNEYQRGSAWLEMKEKYNSKEEGTWVDSQTC